jgi:hypothetical protein
MFALQSCIAEFSGAFIAVRSVAHLVSAGFDHFGQASDAEADVLYQLQKVEPRHR